ncbi:MAG: hypothetical protein FJ295_19000 [Planctomycetes bacterium]|nr:hypothetical protein [Planctomycetota bacterium]
MSNQQSRIGFQSFNSTGLGDAIAGVQRRLYELKSGEAADLANADTLDEVISRINAANNGIRADYNAARSG